MTILSILKEYSKKIDFLDLELILSRVIKKPREFVLAHPEKIITKKQKKVIIKLIKRRAKHEPLAYILGHKEFYGLDFKVSRDVLIPRPETEIIVEEAVKELKRKEIGNKIIIIDIGTGSGNIIITLAKIFEKRKNFQYVGTDISLEALKISKRNARIYKLDKKIKFFKGNLLEPILKNNKILKKNSKILLIANLPYGWSAWKNNSSVEAIGIRFEPSIALFTGKNGLELYEKLLSQLLLFKKSGQDILALFEIDPRQRINITKLIKKRFPATKVKFHKDLAGKWRVAEFTI